MNKLLLSKNGRNHIVIYPLKNILELPADNGERIIFCEKLFNNLQNDESAIRHFYYCNRKRGILAAVYELDNKIYLDYCIHTADKGFYKIIIYVLPLESKEDALSIAKFWSKNLNQIGEDYKNQIIEGKDAFEDFIKDTEVKA